MKTPALITLRRKAGLSSVRGMSATELRRNNPALALKWAGFIQANKSAIVGALVKAL